MLTVSHDTGLSDSQKLNNTPPCCDAIRSWAGETRLELHTSIVLGSIASATVITSLCKDILDVRTAQVGTKHCILTTAVSLSKDNVMGEKIISHHSSCYK